eukprot:scaffold547_cov384-Prasinococcus_capsulatus_cf.AAC.28
MPLRSPRSTRYSLNRLPSTSTARSTTRHGRLAAESWMSSAEDVSACGRGWMEPTQHIPQLSKLYRRVNPLGHNGVDEP